MTTVKVHPQPEDSLLAPNTESLAKTREFVGVDLHNHVAISLGKWTRRVQGYERKNPLSEFANACMDAGLSICAVTSQYPLPTLEPGSFHDRLNWLFNKYEDTLPEGFSAERLGGNLIRVRRQLCCEPQRELYLLAGQTVIAEVNGRQIDHLVVGRSNLPNYRKLEEILELGLVQGLIQIAEHPYCLAHFGLGERELQRFLKYYDAIETHNAQLAFPALLGRVPFFGSYSKALNLKAAAFAEANSKPGVAVSDAHRIQDTGLAYIGVDRKALDFSSEERLLHSLRMQIRGKEYIIPQARSISIAGLANWAGILKLGTYTGKYKNEQ